jgi:hypothetical protein
MALAGYWPSAIFLPPRYEGGFLRLWRRAQGFEGNLHHAARSLGEPCDVSPAMVHRALGADPNEAAMNGLGSAADSLGPIEGLLDLPSVPATQGVAVMPGGLSIDGGMPRIMPEMPCEVPLDL